MKQSHDSSDDYKFSTANETLSEKTALFIWLKKPPLRIPANSDKKIFENFVVLCNDNNVIMFYADGC